MDLCEIGEETRTKKSHELSSFDKISTFRKLIDFRYFWKLENIFNPLTILHARFCKYPENNYSPSEDARWRRKKEEIWNN